MLEIWFASNRYTKVHRHWRLFWRDQHEKFHEHDLVDPNPHLGELIQYVSNDTEGLFWG